MESVPLLQVKRFRLSRRRQTRYAEHGRTKEIAREEKIALTIILPKREESKRRQKERAKAKGMVLHPEAHRRRAGVQGIGPNPSGLQNHPARTDPLQKVKAKEREREKEVAKAKRAKGMPRSAKPTWWENASKLMHATTSILPPASTTCRILAERMRTRACMHTYAPTSTLLFCLHMCVCISTTRRPHLR